MANFRPLKKYLLLLIDDLATKYHLEAPFLDAGCGIGDISLHFAKKGWNGKAIDVSKEAITKASESLAVYPNVIVKKNDIRSVSARYKTVILCDVIEHEANDNSLLRSLQKNLDDDGFLVLSTTISKKEWRWDDEYYGHLRRYEITELRDLLGRNGYEVVEIIDFTFPVFWLIRRIYTELVPKKIVLGDSNHARTSKSSLQSAWDRGVFSTFFEKVIWWQPVFWLQKRFKNRLLGCECLLIARPKSHEAKAGQ